MGPNRPRRAPDGEEQRATQRCWDAFKAKLGFETHGAKNKHELGGWRSSVILLISFFFSIHEGKALAFVMMWTKFWATFGRFGRRIRVH